MFFVSTQFLSNHALINLMRGIAVLLVFLSHADAYDLIKIWPFYIVAIKGYLGGLGVNIFFILSGMLIWQSAEKCNAKSNFKVYAINRITRILPIHWLCIFLVYLTSGFFIGNFEPKPTFSSILSHFFLIQELTPSGSTTINPVTWTLSYEMLFYFLVPILFWIGIKSVYLVVTSILLSQFFWLYFTPSYLTFLKFWPLFGLGILIAISNKTLKTRYSLLVLLTGIIYSISQPNFYFGGFMVAISLVLIAANISNFQLGFLTRIIAGIGIISYSIYIWHYLIIELYGAYTIKYPIFSEFLLLRSFVFTLLIFIFSYLSFIIVEKPFMTSIRSKLIRLAD